MNQFKITRNRFLDSDIQAFYNCDYVGYNKPGNPDFLVTLKNIFNNVTPARLKDASAAVQRILGVDFVELLAIASMPAFTVCVVPRSKAENKFGPQQQRFRKAVREAIALIPDLQDGTEFIQRHTDTFTTHLRRPIERHDNNGDKPYPGITMKTCRISTEVNGRDVLLVDDIYTRGVSIDEDAIAALLKSGAKSVTFYAVGRTVSYQ